MGNASEKILPIAFNFDFLGEMLGLKEFFVTLGSSQRK